MTILGFRKSRDGKTVTHNFISKSDRYDLELNAYYKEEMLSLWDEYSTIDQADANAVYDFFADRSSFAFVEHYNLVELSAAMAGIDTDNTETSGTDKSVKKLKKELTDSVHALQKFMKEFNFEVSYRCLNTFAMYLAKDVKLGKDYLRGYFDLIDNPDTENLVKKMKSPEFDFICNSLKRAPLSNRVNKRFKVYYGNPGGGKTYQAEQEADSTIVCHAGMLPQDLMEDFDFNDQNGNPVFKQSALYKAIVDGKTICLDEINLLSTDCVRFLQGLLDNKATFVWKDKTVQVNPNFNVIGTMNLVVNGTTFYLPEPLVDRAYEIKKFTVTSRTLVEALM